MAEFQAQIKDIRAPANAKRANLVSWRLMPLLVAGVGTFILFGCAGNSIKQNGKEVGSMGNAGTYAFAEQRETAPTDTTKLTRVQRLEEKRRELRKEMPGWDLPMPERGVKTLTPEKKAELIVDMMYRLKEDAMYEAALKGDSAGVAKAKQEILDFAKSRGEVEIGKEKVKLFDALNSQ